MVLACFICIWRPWHLSFCHSPVLSSPLGLSAAWSHRPSHHLVHNKDKWILILENWQNLGHPPAGTTINLHIALKAQNENIFLDTPYDVNILEYQMCVPLHHSSVHTVFTCAAFPW